jgi:hypothetical protein
VIGRMALRGWASSSAAHQQHNVQAILFRMLLGPYYSTLPQQSTEG